MLKEIDILGLTYTIEEREEYDKYGQINHDKQIIVIDKGISDDRKEQTLLHEILHALLYQIGEPELSNNEDLIQRLAAVLRLTLKPYLKI